MWIPSMSVVDIPIFIPNSKWNYNYFLDKHLINLWMASIINGSATPCVLLVNTIKSFEVLSPQKVKMRSNCLINGDIQVLFLMPWAVWHRVLNVSIVWQTSCCENVPWWQAVHNGGRVQMILIEENIQVTIGQKPGGVFWQIGVIPKSCYMTWTKQ